MKSKKFIGVAAGVFVVAAAFAIGAAVSCSGGGKYTAGTYTETAQGRNGDVTVAVTFTSSRIQSIEVTNHQETPGFGDRAIASVIPRMLEAQSADVDVESGASLTSNALITAVNAAIKAAGTDKYTAGTYTETAQGRNGDVTVAVTFTSSRIQSIEVTNHQETPGFGDRAIASVIPRMLEAQSADVDVESGASLTSNALIAAVNAAIAEASGAGGAETVAAQDATCDIVIVGAGGAGLTAAIEAANRGANVIVLEKMGIVGGNTNGATGGINAAYTKEQERLGIQDDTETFFNDTMRGGGYLNDPALVRTLVDNSAAIVEWLQSDIVGADLSDVGLFGGATNRRIHRPQGGAAIGAYLVPLLYAAAQKQGADIRLNNRVTDIIAENGRPVGVTVESPNGSYTVRAGAVIIATGGFGANPEMIVKYRPDLAGFGTTNHSGATGDAFAWVEKFNAELTQMEQIQTHPTVVPGKGIMITEAVRGNGAILVSRTGKRFVDEMETRDVVSAAILGEPGQTAFLFFDQAVRDSLSAIETYANQGLLTEGQTVAEIAGKLNIPADELQRTLDAYAGYVHNKNDAEFGRNPQGLERDLTQAPFYAIEVGPAIHHTMGGLKINPKTEVLNTQEQAIPGLFAAGEVTGGVHGGNRLGGNAVADIEVFGKIAGDSACDYIGK